MGAHATRVCTRGSCGALDIVNAGLPRRAVGATPLAITELGFGGAPLGNLYEPITDSAARDTVAAAIAAGITYFDTAPYYGFGLSERRMGDVLREHGGLIVSTKVGRLLRAEPRVHGSALRHGFYSPLPFEPVFDYSYEGVMRSWEASQQRLGLAQIDILYVHDIGPLTQGERHEATFRQLTEDGGLRALEALRSGGAIGAVGIGVNEIEICLEVMQHARLDVILLAGRYTLLEQRALEALLPACKRAGTSIVVGGPYNSGILATGTRHGGPLHYNYEPAPSAIVERVRRLEAHCARYEVPLAAAALQFPLANPQIASVIPGLANPEYIERTLALYRTRIPPSFWRDLKQDGLVHADAPVPDVAEQV
jgi:D-threo-aldose 1-dehydrogenase